MSRLRRARTFDQSSPVEEVKAEIDKTFASANTFLRRSTSSSTQGLADALYQLHNRFQIWSAAASQNAGDGTAQPYNTQPELLRVFQKIRSIETQAEKTDCQAAPIKAKITELIGTLLGLEESLDHVFSAMIPSRHTNTSRPGYETYSSGPNRTRNPPRRTASESDGYTDPPRGVPRNTNSRHSYRNIWSQDSVVLEGDHIAEPVFLERRNTHGHKYENIYNKNSAVILGDQYGGQSPFLARTQTAPPDPTQPNVSYGRLR